MECAHLYPVAGIAAPLVWVNPTCVRTVNILFFLWVPLCVAPCSPLSSLYRIWDSDPTWHAFLHFVNNKTMVQHATSLVHSTLVSQPCITMLKGL